MFNLKMLRTLVSVGISIDNTKDPLNASLDIIRKKAFIKNIFLQKKKKKNQFKWANPEKRHGVSR